MAGVSEVQTCGRWWQRALVSLLIFPLRLYWATLRFKISVDAMEIFSGVAGSTLFVMWHNNLFITSLVKKMFRKKIQIYGLVSPSSDGAWLAEILGAIGIKAIRGSSKRNGISAISTIVQKLREGACVTITPDGPRGPINKFKNGAAMVAQRAESNVVAFAFGYGCHISLSTWDRFKIPLPFSRIRVGGKMLHFSDFASLPTKKITEMFEAEMELLQSKLQ